MCDTVRDGGGTSEVADITTEPNERDAVKESSEPTVVLHNAALISHDPTPISHEPTLMSHEPTVTSHDQPPMSHDLTPMSHEPTVTPCDQPHDPISHDTSTEPNLSENDTEGLSSVQRLQMVLQSQPPPLIRDIDATDYSEDTTKKRTLAAIVNKISQKEKGEANRVAGDPDGVLLSHQLPSLVEGGRKRGRKRKKSPLAAPVPKRPRGRPKGSIRKKELTGLYVVFSCSLSPPSFSSLLFTSPISPFHPSPLLLSSTLPPSSPPSLIPSLLHPLPPSSSPSLLPSLPPPLPPPLSLSSASSPATGKRRGRKPKQPLPSSTTYTTIPPHLTTTNQNLSFIMSDANAIHGVAGDPIFLKGTSSDAVSLSGAATPPTHPPGGATPPGTNSSTVAANISSVSVIVPAALPSGE